MSTPDDTSRHDEPTSDSSEAIVGTGITVAALGVMFLLLGWAQWMREVHSAAVILLALGAVLFVAGGVVAGMGKSRKGR
jgi:hypothetical protein